MACGKGFLILFTLLASQGFILAQEASSDSSSSDGSVQGAPQSNPADSSSDGSSQRAPQNNPPASEDHDHHRASIFDGLGGGGRPNFGSLFGNSSSNPFGQFISAFSQFFPFPGLGGSGRAQPMDLMSDDFDNQDSYPSDRFFFHSHSSSVPIGCNYTTQGGYSCAGCREQLICRSNGVGRLRVCPFYAPYCNNGLCGSSVNTTCTNSTG